MYNPKYSQVSDLNLQLDFIRRYPLATLITLGSDEIETSYLPFVLEKHEEDIYLVTHLARANPQWKNISQKKFVITFRGPDCYISPTIYKTAQQVPTWNYAVVECSGLLEVVDSIEGLDDIMKTSVKYFEERNKTSWYYDLPEKYKQSLLKAIVGLRFKITNINAKFKLSQNRDDADYEAVKAFLQNSSAPFAQEMLYWF